MFHAKMLCAGAAWMLALTLMVVATAEQIDYLRAWSILAAMIAWLPTQSLLLAHVCRAVATELDGKFKQERVRTERLLQSLAVEFAKSELPRVGSR